MISMCNLSNTVTYLTTTVQQRCDVPTVSPFLQLYLINV